MPVPASTQTVVHLPGLLHLLTGPVQTTLVAFGTIDLWERLEDAEDRIGHHDEQRHHPGGSDDTVGVGAGLPRTRFQGVTDGAVPLDGDGHQAECGDADRDPWRSRKISKK